MGVQEVLHGLMTGFTEVYDWFYMVLLRFMTGFTEFLLELT